MSSLMFSFIEFASGRIPPASSGERRQPWLTPTRATFDLIREKKNKKNPKTGHSPRCQGSTCFIARREPEFKETTAKYVYSTLSRTIYKMPLALTNGISPREQYAFGVTYVTCTKRLPRFVFGVVQVLLDKPKK